MKVIYKYKGKYTEKDYTGADITRPLYQLNQIKKDGKLIDIPKDDPDYIEIYWIEEKTIENPNPDKYRVVRGETIYTDELHPEYPHFKIARKTWQLVEISQDEIIERLNSELGNYVDPLYPVAVRLKHLMQPSKGEAKDNEIKARQNWLLSCQDERQRREDEYLKNGTFPDFGKWPEYVKPKN